MSTTPDVLGPVTHQRTNRAFRLRRRPNGPATADDLTLVTEPIAPLREGQALARTLFLSIDPASRIWMGHDRPFMPAVPIGAVMRGLGVCQIVASRRADMDVGDLVAGFTGWQEYCVVDDATLDAPLSVLPSPPPAPPSAFVGVLGHTGISAYLGIDFLDPQPGQTVVVSAAAGAVGSVAGQLAKERGARVVGIAGGPEKSRHVVEDLGFDACIDHRAADWQAQLDAATPDGVDLDFENVGGEIMDHILMRMNLHARVFVCGLIAHYNAGDRDTWRGLVNFDQVQMQRVTLCGFIVTDHLDRWPEAINYLAARLATGRLRNEETVLEGLDAAPAALDRIFSGAEIGKIVLHIADPA
ncbi:NADP-dependent oxidoreductase [Pseudonocardia adelaidensis]|uniref:NADP-dependent oxidoreductase n=1 Tax=Pseudonocardia adelaidensis TaxID=648754 RepID=A0ABP9PA01_9PSEU